jgi:hypothetical protein
VPWASVRECHPSYRQQVSAESTATRFREHAGLEPSSGAPTVSAATAEPVDARGLAEAVSDFLALLDVLNYELNGTNPSDTTSGKAETISTDVAYAVAEVARMLRDAGADREAWAVETGWLAVLAGDIDDVRQHVAEEEAARGR